MNSEMQISLKLLIDRSTKKVLFAEAGKEFVDFIIHMMSLPLASVVKLLNQNNIMVGCLGDLYKSVESLNIQYFESDAAKNSVLNPKAAVSLPLLLLTDSDAPTTDTTPAKFYRELPIEMKYVAGATNTTSPTTSSGIGGTVKGVVTYMVMDNLEVKPMSTISSIILINKFHVKDVSSLEDKEVVLGLNEGLAILKESLETKAVLTSVFLGNKL